MILNGYTYLTHKIVPRNTGPECRFAVVRLSDGMEIADTINIPSEDISSEDLALLVQAHLDKISTPTPADPVNPAIPAVSIVDMSLSATKDRLKTFGCGYIKYNPSCSEAEYFQSFYEAFPEEDAMMAPKLVKIYMTNAYNDGLISEATFEAFRDFVAATPIETLMSL